jgi:beta-glucosidase
MANAIAVALSGPMVDLAPPDEPPEPTSLRFPVGFISGVATASYQVEGDIDSNDWHSFTTSRAIQQRVRQLTSVAGSPTVLQPAGAAVQHHNLAVLQADLDRAQLLGMNAYRFSLEWSRIQPEPPRRSALDDADFNQGAIDFYRAATRVPIGLPF